MTALPDPQDWKRFATPISTPWPRCGIELRAPERIDIAAQQKLQQIWLPSGDDVQIRRVEMTLGAGASAHIFALNMRAIMAASSLT